MTYKSDANDFYRRWYRQFGRVSEQEDLEQAYDEGNAIWVSGVGYVPKRRKINIPGGRGE